MDSRKNKGLLLYYEIMNHFKYNYKLVVENSKLIIDTLNATNKVITNRSKIGQA